MQILVESISCERNSETTTRTRNQRPQVLGQKSSKSTFDAICRLPEVDQGYSPPAALVHESPFEKVRTEPIYEKKDLFPGHTDSNLCVLFDKIKPLVGFSNPDMTLTPHEDDSSLLYYELTSDGIWIFGFRNGSSNFRDIDDVIFIPPNLDKHLAQLHRPGPVIEEHYFVSAVLGRRRENGCQRYAILWKGYPLKDQIIKDNKENWWRCGACLIF